MKKQKNICLVTILELSSTKTSEKILKVFPVTEIEGKEHEKALRDAGLLSRV